VGARRSAPRVPGVEGWFSREAADGVRGGSVFARLLGLGRAVVESIRVEEGSWW
jgi:hypothetical protein